jgi:hypothetical protein
LARRCAQARIGAADRFSAHDRAATQAVRIVPPALWRHLGEQLGLAAPDLASLRSMYQRRRTLFEHQEVACETLRFRWLSDAQRRALARILPDELTRRSDRRRLLQCARRWLYEHRLIVLRERNLRMMTIKAIRQHEAELAPPLLQMRLHSHIDDLGSLLCWLDQYSATIAQVRLPLCQSSPLKPFVPERALRESQ